MMRKDTIDALRKLFKEFPSGVHGYARVVHGAVEKEILLAAEETVRIRSLEGHLSILTAFYCDRIAA